MRSKGSKLWPENNPDKQRDRWTDRRKENHTGLGKTFTYPLTRAVMTELNIKNN